MELITKAIRGTQDVLPEESLCSLHEYAAAFTCPA